MVHIPTTGRRKRDHGISLLDFRYTPATLAAILLRSKSDAITTSTYENTQTGFAHFKYFEQIYWLCWREKHRKVLHNLLTKSANHLLTSKTSSNMAEVTAFATCFTALGFKQRVRTALALQGLQTGADLLSLTTKDLEKLISHCQNKRNMARDPAIPRPVFPFLAVKRLQAFYLWTSYQDSRDSLSVQCSFCPP
jgi:hypothetical protein